MADAAETVKTMKPDPLDHDGDGVKGGFKGAQAHRVWVVSPRDGLHEVAASEVGAVEAAGGRRATARDLAVAGHDAD